MSNHFRFAVAIIMVAVCVGGVGVLRWNRASDSEIGYKMREAETGPAHRKALRESLAANTPTPPAPKSSPFMMKPAVRVPARVDPDYALEVVKSCDVEALAGLLDEDPSLIKRRDSGGFTLLQEASTQHEPRSVGLLIERGADLNAKDDRGLTPLHYATMSDEFENARLLLAAGARVNAVARGARNTTPLHAAALMGRAAVAKLLLTYGANVNARAEKGYTPLVVAEKQGSPELVELLRKHGGHR